MIIGKSRTNQTVEGSKELEQSLEGKANVWHLNEFIDAGIFDNLPSGVKEGDIIIDNDNPFTGIVRYINSSFKELQVWGCEDVEQPVLFTLVDNVWTYSPFNQGTKLYLHTGTVGPETYSIICPESQSFNESNVSGMYLGYSSSSMISCYIIYNDELQQFELYDTSGNTLDVGSIIDTVTPL